MAKARVDHLAGSILLEETGVIYFNRLIIIFGIIFISVFIWWSSYTRVNEVAVAEGEIIPTSQVRNIQHLTGGIISEILVEEGQVVKIGEELVRLNTADSQTQLDIAFVQQVALMSQKNRLQAFINSLEAHTKSVNPKEIEFKELQEKVFNQLEEYHRTQRALFKSQVDQVKNEIEVMNSTEVRIRNQKSSLEKELALRKELVDKGFETRVNYITLQRKYIEWDQKLLNQNFMPMEERVIFSFFNLLDLQNEIKKLSAITDVEKEELNWQKTNPEAIKSMNIMETEIKLEI